MKNKIDKDYIKKGLNFHKDLFDTRRLWIYRLIGVRARPLEILDSRQKERLVRTGR